MATLFDGQLMLAVDGNPLTRQLLLLSTTPVDSPLLPLVALGDNQAVTACIDRYSGLVWSLAKRFLSDHGAAEDAVQEIFLEVWKVAQRFDPAKGSEVSFIATLTRRRLIDRVRRQARRKEHHVLLEEPQSTDSLPEQTLASREDLEHAKQLIAILPPQTRDAVELALYHGLTHNEVSARMDIPLGTAKSLIRRGIDKIRQSVPTSLASMPPLS
jgi:RNA polymerase sigma-70 factor (ECF subfamily)